MTFSYHIIKSLQPYTFCYGNLLCMLSHIPFYCSNPLYFCQYMLLHPSNSIFLMLLFTPTMLTATESSLLKVHLQRKAGFFSATTYSYVLCSKCKVLPVNSNLVIHFLTVSTINVQTCLNCYQLFLAALYITYQCLLVLTNDHSYHFQSTSSYPHQKHLLSWQ